jgi:Fe2+ transport system protein FeoA
VGEPALVERQLHSRRRTRKASPDLLGTLLLVALDHAALGQVLGEAHRGRHARGVRPEEHREAEGRRQAVPLLGLGILAGALLALVVKAGAQALLGRRILGIAAFLRSEEAGQIPA